MEHSKKRGVMHGFTDNYIRVELHVDPSVTKTLDNTIVDLVLGDWNEKGDALVATLAR